MPAPQYPSHMTPDGRTSLLQKATNGGTQSMLGIWRRSLRPEVFPLLAIMGGAGLLVVGYGGHHLMSSPDVRINKTTRKKTIRENHEEGARWVRHHSSLRNLGPRYIQFEEPKQK